MSIEDIENLYDINKIEDAIIELVLIYWRIRYRFIIHCYKIRFACNDNFMLYLYLVQKINRVHLPYFSPE
jgi:hypothetical protein